MISENEFTRNEYRRLQAMPPGAVVAEMAVIKEWIVRDARYPDFLLIVYVRPLEDGTIATACSCSEGAQDKPCLHALKVITEIKDQPHLLRELFAPRESSAAA